MRIDLNKPAYDATQELVKPVKNKKKKNVFTNSLAIIIVTVLIITFIFLIRKYMDKPALTSFQDRVDMTINLARESVEADTNKDDYILIKFPDTKNIISKNDYMKYNGKKLKAFTKGYIIIYKDESIAFKLSDGKYCASKSFTKGSYDLYIFGDCLDYKVVYK